MLKCNDNSTTSHLYTRFSNIEAQKYLCIFKLMDINQDLIAAGELRRSIRIYQCTPTVLLDMCVLPHSHHVNGGLW